jgi:hypothetical protein
LHREVGGQRKLAVTDFAASIVVEQDMPLGVQGPVQPSKTQPKKTLAVSVTSVPPG